MSQPSANLSIVSCIVTVAAAGCRHVPVLMLTIAVSKFFWGSLFMRQWTPLMNPFDDYFEKCCRASLKRIAVKNSKSKQIVLVAVGFKPMASYLEA